jgi:hypothetical protein
MALMGNGGQWRTARRRGHPHPRPPPPPPPVLFPISYIFPRPHTPGAGAGTGYWRRLALAHARNTQYATTPNTRHARRATRDAQPTGPATRTALYPMAPSISHAVACPLLTVSSVGIPIPSPEPGGRTEDEGRPYFSAGHLLGLPFFLGLLPISDWPLSAVSHSRYTECAIARRALEYHTVRSLWAVRARIYMPSSCLAQPLMVSMEGISL